MDMTNTIMMESEQNLITEKEYYYGTIKNLSNGNDVSFLNRGSVYYLVDKKQKSGSTNLIKHPYIILQSTYLDTVGKITVFTISSTPAYTNMIPIIMKGTIGYINPHHPYTYNVSDFFDHERSSYIGNITNETVLELIGNMYGMHLGLNLMKSNDEIVNDYLNYVEEFNARSEGIARYERKVLPKDTSLEKLDLHVSFASMPVRESDAMIASDCDNEYDDDNTVIEENEENTDDESIIVPEIADDKPKEEVKVEETVVKENNVIEPENVEISTTNSTKPSVTRKTRKAHSNATIAKAVRMYNDNKYTVDEILAKTGIAYGTLYDAVKNTDSTPRSKKIILDVRSNCQALLSTIAAMETSPVGTIKFKSKVNDMTADEISILFLYVYLNSKEDAALLYNCTTQTINYRMNKIREKYDVRIH